MKHRDEIGDSMSLFADIITGTLGIIMLTALFFALRVMGTSAGVVGLPDKPELDSELAVERRNAARARLAELDAALAQRQSEEGSQAAAEASERDALTWMSGRFPSEEFSGQTPAAARLRDLVRREQRLVELQVLQAASDRLGDSYRDRLRHAVEEFVAKVATPLRLPHESEPQVAVQSLCLLVRGNRVHPLHTLLDGRVKPDNERNNWNTFPGETGKELFEPREGLDWPPDQTLELLRQTAEAVSAVGNCQIVLLVNPDSFVLAREILRALDQSEALHTWRPWLDKKYVTFSSNGLPIPAARK